MNKTKIFGNRFVLWKFYWYYNSVHSKIFNSEQLKSIFKSILDQKISLLNEVDFIYKSDSLQSSLEDEVQKRIFDFFVLSATAAEACAPGGSIFFKRYVQNPTELECKIQSFNKKDSNQVFHTMAAGTEIADVFSQLSKFCSLKTKLVISDVEFQREKTVVELLKGFTFESLTPAFSIKNKEFISPRVICVDGFIESVSEIHHFLEEVSSLKENAFIFARGASDEVIHTLKINYDRNTLICIPVIVTYDLEGANLLNDIATVCNADLISSLKGDLISSIRAKDSSRVDSITVSNPGIIVKNQKANHNINDYVLRLQRKAQDTNNDFVYDSLKKRIQRLGTEQVNLFLSKQHQKQKFLFDRCIRSIKSCADHGIVYLKDGCYPAAAIKAGEFFGKKFLASIKDLGCIVT
jgi:hypothetical protein